MEFKCFPLYYITFLKCKEIYIKLLKTKLNLCYIRNQTVPRCEHFPPQL